jgi:hypothetical protein
MRILGVVLLATSVAVVLASGIAARLRYYGSERIAAGTLRLTALGLTGVVAGVLLLALASR